MDTKKILVLTKYIRLTRVIRYVLRIIGGIALMIIVMMAMVVVPSDFCKIPFQGMMTIWGSAIMIIESVSMILIIEFITKKEEAERGSQ